MITRPGHTKRFFVSLSRLKRIFSLTREKMKLQFMALILICFVIAFVSFAFFYFSIQAYFNTAQYKNRAEERVLRFKRDFQTYVLEKDISYMDADIIGSWARKNRASVFIDRTKTREAGESRIKIDAGPDGPITSLSAIIQFPDGEAFAIFSYNASSSNRFISWVVSLLLSFDVFLLSLFFMLKRKIDYILRIEEGIGVMESGRFDYAIPVEGKDELARLATGLNLMNRSIQIRADSEQRALEANRRIIRDISHDIRAPLTVGMGYLALLLEKDNLSELERKEYLALVMKKAEQIKERTKMLLEFSTLISGQLPVNKTVINARTMLNQLKDELSALAVLQTEDEVPDGTEINGDTKLLERLFDNLMSNLKKHGDETRPVHFRAYLDERNVHIEIENFVSNEPTSEKGALLGLKICTRIMELHEGSFSHSQTKDVFHIDISIPVIN